MAKDNKTLHLVLKKKWWNMIASGEKREEYREIKPHWLKRFCNPVTGCCKDCRVCYKTIPYDYTVKDFIFVCFHLGYTNTTMTFQIREIVIDKGREEWGAEPNKEYFVIKLGERVE